MKETLFILLVIGLLLAFTAYKYRKQLRAMREFWRMAKDMRQMTSQMRKEVEEPKATAPGKLVNCSKCGTWVPEDRAIRLGRTSVFCSSKCLERSAQSV
jgi:Sec-independent protein translocase protein TatA